MSPELREEIDCCGECASLKMNNYIPGVCQYHIDQQIAVDNAKEFKPTLKDVLRYAEDCNYTTEMRNGERYFVGENSDMDYSTLEEAYINEVGEPNE